jgi:hypothetical protein
VRRDDEGISEG